MCECASLRIGMAVVELAHVSAVLLCAHCVFPHAGIEESCRQQQVIGFYILRLKSQVLGPGSQVLGASGAFCVRFSATAGVVQGGVTCDVRGVRSEV